jgi:hypothetical protein
VAVISELDNAVGHCVKPVSSPLPPQDALGGVGGHQKLNGNRESRASQLCRQYHHRVCEEVIRSEREGDSRVSQFVARFFTEHARKEWSHQNSKSEEEDRGWPVSS